MPTMIRLIYRGRVGGERESEREECFCVSLSFYTSSASAAPSDRLSPILLCSFGARLIPLYLISSSFSLSLSPCTPRFCCYSKLRAWNFETLE